MLDSQVHLIVYCSKEKFCYSNIRNRAHTQMLALWVEANNENKTMNYRHGSLLFGRRDIEDPSQHELLEYSDRSVKGRISPSLFISTSSCSTQAATQMRNPLTHPLCNMVPASNGKIVVSERLERYPAKNGRTWQRAEDPDGLPGLHLEPCLNVWPKWE